MNAIAILIGSLIGLLTGRAMKSGLREPVMCVLGLITLTLGIKMVLGKADTLMVLAALVLGTIAGESLRIEGRIASACDWLERKINHSPGSNEIVDGFMASTLLFCVGAMAITGSLESGLTGQHHILTVKAVMDGVASIVLANTYGPGVALSAGPVLTYEGLLALFARSIKGILTMAEAELHETGGVLLIAIGLNILGVTRLRVANMLPGLIIVPLLSALKDFFS